MKIEYDPIRDLLYLWLREPGTKAARTIAVIPGVHADLDASDKLIGLEIMDAEEILGGKVQFQVTLSSSAARVKSA